MRDTILSVATDAIKIIEQMGRPDVSVTLIDRINRIMGWNN